MTDPMAVVERLRQAVDDHDLDALADCFRSDYRNETPVHPARGFVGRDQVRANWSRIFGGLPDVTATVVRSAIDGDAAWTEWELRGTRPDGITQLLRGVIVFGVVDDAFGWARFYLEPVDGDESSVDDAVGHIVGDRR